MGITGTPAAASCSSSHTGSRGSSDSDGCKQNTTATRPTSYDGSNSDVESTAYDEFADYHIKVAYGESEKRWSWRKLFKFFGPGFIICMADIDPGNLESSIQLAYVAKYKLLWLLLLAHVLSIVVQSLSARLGIVTGKHLAQHMRTQYPKKHSAFFWITCELAIIGADIQEVIGTSIALHLLAGIPIWAGVIITAVDSFLFLFVQKLGVRATELTFAVLVATMFVCFWIDMFRIKPPAGEVAKSLFYPRIPSGTIVQAVGTIRCVLMPHNFYLHSALVGSRKIDRTPRNRLRAVRQAIKYFRVETSVGIFFAFMINLAIVCVFVKVFEFLDLQEASYTPGFADCADGLGAVIGATARYIFIVGLLASGQSSTMAGTMAGQFVFEGFWSIPVKPWLRVAITRAISLVPALAVALAASSHMDTLDEVINVIQSIVLPFTIIPMLKMQAVPRIIGEEFAFGRWATCTMALLALAVCVLNAYMVASIIPLTSPGMYVAMVFTVAAYSLAVLYVALLPLKHQERAVVDRAPRQIRRFFNRE
ncbi:Nramp-domain-containing protein [Martensiomyces pterosporus]|nr:Nramp-domain-containing protein [Martensiomyces pterosporus]